MPHARSLSFDALEARKLLSHVHVHVHVKPAHAAHAALRTPLSLDGTLTVNTRAQSTTMNADGSATTSAPVSGQLGALGPVHGYWVEDGDTMGNPGGLDTLALHAEHGGVVIAFNNAHPGKAHPVGHGAVYYQHNQRLAQGTGAYARAIESGTLQLTTNDARSKVVTITLTSQNG